ncbi:LOW QUALITY PROTEIN: hypothetical protein PFFVO_01788 [Plasmodium falciparum Vietnam Oak-Knoll (FVO)]|uniref:Uncharacterized protein n=1 Tax=Plasmodium falciparum Vietnam Oak-Knoll (FVO) TaxID=1036723 RepID=A0A024V9U6_PLAFA|nr:LOW QUALITY PROTEIN: hypothetical protein PFFVO_01788 [Plasmodium falciparum Vietnam Oak-Knoll (FVO)]
MRIFEAVKCIQCIKYCLMSFCLHIHLFSIIIETLNNVPLVSFTIIFFYFVIKYDYKNLFKSKE